MKINYEQKYFIIPLLIVFFSLSIIWLFFFNNGEETSTSVSDSKEIAVESVNSMPPVMTDPSNKAETQYRNINIWLYIAIFVLALTTFCSVSISFYLYKWRRILLANPNLLVPEEWGKYLESVGKNINSLTKALSDNIELISSKTSDNSDKIVNMVDTYMSLQKALDEKDAEILRLKKGYDAVIFRKFLFRFIRIDQSLEDYIQSGETSLEQLKQLRRLFEDAFDECGVEPFSPNIGEDYRRTQGIADNPKSMKTEKPEDEFMIAEVLEAGYRMGNNGEYEIIVPAKVKIYTLGD